MADHDQAGVSDDELDVNFSMLLDRKFICPICLLVLRRPMQTKCGHRFCEKCIMQALNQSTAPCCPADNIPIAKASELFLDLAFSREIGSLLVSCKNAADGCPWTGELSSYKCHLPECMARKVKCTNKGCTEELRKGDMEKHLEACLHRHVTCTHCGEEMAFKHTAMHHLINCRKVPVCCIFCGLSFPKMSLADHQGIDGDCPKTSVQCCYEAVGCMAEIKREELGLHLKNQLIEHCKLMVTAFQSLEARISQLETEVTANKFKSQNLLEKISEISQFYPLCRNSLSENYTGWLLWHVNVYTHCNILYSPSFYTSIPGYRVSICLEISGHREGPDVYTSLFCIIESGKFDNFLTFPFNAFCHVTLYNQSEVDKHKDNYTTFIHCSEVPQCIEETPGVVRRGRLKFMKRNCFLNSHFLRNNHALIEIKVFLQ